MTRSRSARRNASRAAASASLSPSLDQLTLASFDDSASFASFDSQSYFGASSASAYLTPEHEESAINPPAAARHDEFYDFHAASVPHFHSVDQRDEETSLVSFDQQSFDQQHRSHQHQHQQGEGSYEQEFEDQQDDFPHDSFPTARQADQNSRFADEESHSETDVETREETHTHPTEHRITPRANQRPTPRRQQGEADRRVQNRRLQIQQYDNESTLEEQKYESNQEEEQQEFDQSVTVQPTQSDATQATAPIVAEPDDVEEPLDADIQERLDQIKAANAVLVEEYKRLVTESDDLAAERDELLHTLNVDLKQQMAAKRAELEQINMQMQRMNLEVKPQLTKLLARRERAVQALKEAKANHQQWRLEMARKMHAACDRFEARKERIRFIRELRQSSQSEAANQSKQSKQSDDQSIDQDSVNIASNPLVNHTDMLSFASLIDPRLSILFSSSSLIAG